MRCAHIMVSFAAGVMLAGYGTAFGQQTTAVPATDTQAVTETAPKNESPLVSAAKSGGPKKKSRIKINDKTVKAANGKLIEMKTTVPQAKEKVAPPVQQEPAVNPQIERDKKVKAAQEKVEQARSQVSELEKELTRLEEDFYNEDDPGIRDEVIQKRFEDTKKRLESARQDLADARANADAAASAPLEERRY